MASLHPEDILKVYSDDDATRLGVPAWCRLTGNTLIEVKELDATQTEFYIKKKKS
jgi:TusA-related sulfurtransferase